MFFFFTSLLLGVFLVIVISLLSKKRRFDREIRRPFECGFPTKEERRAPFSLRFFLVAMVFLIFDVEILLLFPLLTGLLFRDILVIVLISFNFLLILSVGLFYE